HGRFHTRSLASHDRQYSPQDPRIADPGAGGRGCRGSRQNLRRRTALGTGRRRFMNELEFVDKLRRSWPLIGDDCAVIRPPAGQELLFSTDFSIENVHFKREMSAKDIGKRAIARGLSDIAAMGGKALYCLISLALAPWTDRKWLNGFYS